MPSAGVVPEGSRRPFGGAISEGGGEGGWRCRTGGLEDRGVRSLCPLSGAVPLAVTPALCEENSAGFLSSVFALVIRRARGMVRLNHPQKGEPGCIPVRLKSVLPEKGSLGNFCDQACCLAPNEKSKDAPRELAISDVCRTSGPRRGTDTGAFVRRKLSLGRTSLDGAEKTVSLSRLPS